MDRVNSPNGSTASVRHVFIGHVRLSSMIKELVQAREYAEKSNRSLWDFALEIDLLRQLGANRNDFRYLTCMGYVQHAIEVTGPRETTRRFQSGSELTFDGRESFVLTGKGLEFAQSLLDLTASHPVAKERQSSASELSCMPVATSPEPLVLCDVAPSWDGDRHELRIGGRLIKQFKWPAANQEIILATIQEDDWVAKIDDSLPSQTELDPKRRLHDTIKCLNRKQTNKLVRFRGDGTGEGVIWELIETNHDNGHS